MPRQAITSVMQWAAKTRDLPFDYPRTEVALFGGLWGGALWELENLALFNQAAYSDVEARNRHLDVRAAELREAEKRTKGLADDDQAEFAERILYRRKDAIFAGELEVEAITRYADEVTVVATWAFVEKHLNETLRALQETMGVPLVGGHRWPDIEQAYVACGVALRQLTSFADADECRRLNNAIKHSGVVGGALLNFAAFAGKEGARLDRLELDTQRYYFGAGAFVAAAVENASEVAQGHVAE